MVSVDTAAACSVGPEAQVGAGPHSLNEPGELFQWLQHEDSIINSRVYYYFY